MRKTSEPVFASSAQRVLLSRATPEAIRPETSGVSCPPKRFSRTATEAEDTGASEIRKIMQRGTNHGSPAPASWLGMSPPTRTTGAANPLVQDFNWRSNAYRCSHSNLQALREIDARGVSFLQCSSQGGDSRLLVESPDYGLLSAEDSTDAENTIQYIPSSRESCQAGSTKGHMPVGQPLSYQIGFVTN
ncbi:g11566 [Coccomyxa viridis]|uniref:G11566 protein n=1 Tax=Coccomyxa viridis TaxID=1274662 RepID=A0ABP1G8J1_9CHLO